LANVQFDANNNSNSGYKAKGYSDANGNYAVAVLGDGTNYWSCNADSGKSSALPSYVLNTFDLQVLANNQTVQENYIALPASAIPSRFR